LLKLNGFEEKGSCEEKVKLTVDAGVHRDEAVSRGAELLDSVGSGFDSYSISTVRPYRLTFYASLCSATAHSGTY
jgi:hypothetical protein